MKAKVLIIKSICICLLLVAGSVTLSLSEFSKKAFAAPDSCSPPATTYGTDTLSVYIPMAATYTLWTRIMAVPNSTAFLLNVDNNTACYNVGGDSSIPTNSTWDWVNDYDGNTSNVINISLSQGTHTFVVTGTKSGLSVDRLVAIAVNGSGGISCTPTNTNDNTAGNNCAPLANTGGAPSNSTPTLNSGQTLTSNSSLKSSNGQYTAVMQTDGNFVVYNASAKALWASGTDSNNGSKAVMQTDGNFVIYNASAKALWASGTNGYSGSSLVMQNDGNLVIYNASGRALWSIFTGPLFSTLNSSQTLTSNDLLKSSNGQYISVMQGDGNFVVYNASGRPLWASGTDGNNGSKAVMQGDGNFVVYNASAKALWASGTDSNNGSKAVMQGDGNFVVYNANGRALWSRLTGRL